MTQILPKAPWKLFHLFRKAGAKVAGVARAFVMDGGGEMNRPTLRSGLSLTTVIPRSGMRIMATVPSPTNSRAAAAISRKPNRRRLSIFKETASYRLYLRLPWPRR